jgi:hypothetical protein
MAANESHSAEEVLFPTQLMEEIQVIISIQTDFGSVSFHTYAINIYINNNV